MASTLLYAVFSNTTKCGINLTAWIASVILFSSLLGDSVILCVSEWIRFCSFIVCSSKMQVPSLCPTTFKVQNCRRAKIKKTKNTQGPRELGSAALAPAGYDKEGGGWSWIMRGSPLASWGMLNSPRGTQLAAKPRETIRGLALRLCQISPKENDPSTFPEASKGRAKGCKERSPYFSPVPVYLFPSFVPDTFPVVSSLDMWLQKKHSYLFSGVWILDFSLLKKRKCIITVMKYGWTAMKLRINRNYSDVTIWASWGARNCELTAKLPHFIERERHRERRGREVGESNRGGVQGRDGVSEGV